MVRRKTAFTLLELLTVIAIMGMLMAILVPSLSAARRHAKASACLSKIKGIGTGFSLYLNENSDQFPPFQLFKVPAGAEKQYVNSYGAQAPRWQWFIETELGPVINPLPFRYRIESGGFFDDDTVGRPGMQSARKMSHDVFTCPSLDDDNFALDIRDGAYGYNYQYLGNTREDTHPGRWDNFSVGLHRIQKTGQTVMLADSRGAGLDHGRHSYTLDPPRRAVERNAAKFGPKPGAWSGEPDSGHVSPGLDPNVFAYSPVEMRHNNRGNVLFVDTHAAAMTFAELGYQLSDGKYPQGIRSGIACGISEPMDGRYTATNRLWNGDGVDPIAEEHRPE